VGKKLRRNLKGKRAGTLQVKEELDEKMGLVAWMMKEKKYSVNEVSRSIRNLNAMNKEQHECSFGETYKDPTASTWIAYVGWLEVARIGMESESGSWRSWHR